MSVSRGDGTLVELGNLALAPAVSFLNRRLLQVGETATVVIAKRLRSFEKRITSWTAHSGL